MSKKLNIDKNILKESKINENKNEENASSNNLIKSLYVLKEILSFLNLEQKLNIIIYNKGLQKEEGINIEFYKKSSGKYIICQNGEGKEYILNTNILIYEGAYLNKKRNGKGKEYYYNGKLKFEGEYLNGKEWNGEGYDPEGDFAYEIKDGKGYKEEYDNNGKLIFKGNYLNGERNGLGTTSYFNDYIKFQGNYLNGVRDGNEKNIILHILIITTLLLKVN